MCKILFLDWNSYGNLDILSAIDELKASGRDIRIELYPYDNHIERDDKQFADKFKTDLQKKSPDFVMSFNFFPIVSGVCNEVGIKYVSWVYDNPAINLYSFTLINPCNYVFLFDSQMYEVFANQGIKTVYYLPMAAAVERYDSFEKSDVFRKKWGGELAFVGNLYTEGHNYYDQIEDKLSDYSKGYINGLMRAQMEINGASIVEGSIPENVMKEMVDAFGAKPNYDGVETYDYIYSNYVVDRKITALERTEMLTMIGKKHSVNLFTGDKNFKPEGISNRGKVDYYKEMPYIFKNTDINLNITLRSIQRGIPLRCMDIMGCGGFLLTNYQEDFLHFFEPFEDYVYFESRQDLMDKIEYYLTHEGERNRIAKSGYEKIKANHTYRLRLEEILDIVGN
ncbi:CgeB family protein [Butyrivibrio sp. AE3009]|uniref:CgeB family protein n=1 Tax=Butyrivibrio sp. AE3009 TaxID=1280666 RepID=UPI0003B4F109|nr:DUF3880 domain-containing protein [Butyrivibrio sp. AE3009]